MLATGARHSPRELSAKVSRAHVVDDEVNRRVYRHAQVADVAHVASRVFYV
jgi:hypothetical protein